MKRKNLVVALPLAIGAGLLGARFARACLISLEQGIHFKGTPADFGTPPPRYALRSYSIDDSSVSWRPGTRYVYGDFAESGGPPAGPPRDLREALSAEDQGRVAGALEAYRRLNREGKSDPNFIRQRIELLDLAAKSQDRSGLAPFLAATNPLTAAGHLPNEGSCAAFLRPFVAYRIAGAAYDGNRFDEAAAAYRRCAESYPESPRAEPAMIMAVRCLLAADEPGNPRVEEAKRDLDAFEAKYPNSRFRLDSLGWRARIAFLQERYPVAESAYRRIAEGAQNQGARFRAYDSLRICGQKTGDKVLEAEALVRELDSPGFLQVGAVALDDLEGILSKMDGDQASALSVRLRNDPSLLVSYMRLRLDVTRTNGKERAELKRICEACLEKNAAMKDADYWRVKLWLARLEYDSDSAEAAGELAGSARDHFARGVDDWAVGQYLVASCDYRLGRFDSALDGYRRLVAGAPHSFLVNGAVECIAYICDRKGRLGEALDALYRLGYSTDIAYMVDAKMSIPQLRAYVRSHPHHAQRDVLVYSLGLRFLRKNMFAQAEAMFVSIPGRERKRMAVPNSQDSGPLDRFYDPLEVCRTLAAFDRSFRRARGSEAKAAALYKTASYFYERRNLLLYNLPLWNEFRAESIAYSWNAKIATAADDKAMHEHHYEHECLEHAYRICRKILAEYPRTKVAPAAGYRAACAAERLSNFNPWWRWEGARTHLDSVAGNLMASVAKSYPDSPLAGPAKKYAGAFYEEAAQNENQGLWRKMRRFGEFEGG